jgi:hypothetical protein
VAICVSKEMLNIMYLVGNLSFVHIWGIKKEVTLVENGGVACIEIHGRLRIG